MKIFYKILGLVLVALGVVGILLPVLPATPFLLAAVWAFGRSSEWLRRWLLTNRVFGGYVRHYRSGRGIPLKMRLWTLSLLWATIGFSVWRVDPLWLKIMLPCIAVAVTVHVWGLGRRGVLVLVPTMDEAADLQRVVGMDGVIISGVGMAETAAAVACALRRRPRMLILAGVAGASGGLKVGDCVSVATERVAGLPDIYNKVYECPWASLAGLPLAAGVTVSRSGDGVSAGAGVEVENMEGAAFFAACTAARVRFLELRAVSNTVDAPRSEWRVPEAAAALAAAVERYFDSLEK